MLEQRPGDAASGPEWCHSDLEARDSFPLPEGNDTLFVNYLGVVIPDKGLSGAQEVSDTTDTKKPTQLKRHDKIQIRAKIYRLGLIFNYVFPPSHSEWAVIPSKRGLWHNRQSDIFLAKRKRDPSSELGMQTYIQTEQTPLILEGSEFSAESGGVVVVGGSFDLCSVKVTFS